MTEAIKTDSLTASVAGALLKPVSEAIYNGLKYSVILGATGLLVGAPFNGMQIGFIYGVGNYLLSGKTTAPSSSNGPSFSDLVTAVGNAAAEDLKNSNVTQVAAQAKTWINQNG